MNIHNHTALIQKLLDCVLACENCATESLREDNTGEMSRCISLDRDCADICAQGARLLQRKSEIGHQFLVICEEICPLCADECRKHQAEHCQLCADACYECAEACHEHHHPITQV